MSTPAEVWPALPYAEALIVNDPMWSHPGISVGGVAHLRVWSSVDGRHLAVVTEQGVGCSTTNAAEYIHAALVEQYGPGVVHLEHYPASQRVIGPDSLDEVTVTIDGEPLWRRVWPTPPSNPHHAEFTAWTRSGGSAVLATLTGGDR